MNIYKITICYCKEHSYPFKNVDPVFFKIPPDFAQMITIATKECREAKYYEFLIPIYTLASMLAILNRYGNIDKLFNFTLKYMSVMQVWSWRATFIFGLQFIIMMDL